jgi:hypothetical protein
MSLVCEHNAFGLCAKCKDLKPYTVFRDNPDCNKSGEEDHCCGYFWGPPAPENLIGKKVKTG